MCWEYCDKKTFATRISPKSFFQTNTKQAENLYRVVREFAALSGHETVYDLYCGTGSIGIFLSNYAKKIIEKLTDEMIDVTELFLIWSKKTIEKFNELD